MQNSNPALHIYSKNEVCEEPNTSSATVGYIQTSLSDEKAAIASPESDVDLNIPVSNNKPILVSRVAHFNPLRWLGGGALKRNAEENVSDLVATEATKQETAINIAQEDMNKLYETVNSVKAEVSQHIQKLQVRVPNLESLQERSRKLNERTKDLQITARASKKALFKRFHRAGVLAAFALTFIALIVCVAHIIK